MSLHLLRLRRFAIKLCNDELLQMLCRNIKLFSWERENIDSLLWHWSIQIEMDTDSLVQLCENEISLWKAKSQIFCFFAFEEMIQNQAKLSKFVFWKRQILFSIKSILFIFSRKNWMAFPIWREENFQFILKWTTSLQCFLFKMLANLGKLC